jgi:hypothetical protein
MTVWNDHNEKKRAGNTTFTSKAMSSPERPCRHPCGRAGAFRPAPRRAVHRPGAAGEILYGGICLDLSHVPLKHAITVPEMEARR